MRAGLGGSNCPPADAALLLVVDADSTPTAGGVGIVQIMN